MFPSVALACSCRESPEPLMALVEADVVFVGEVIDSRKELFSRYGEIIYKFKVEEHWKNVDRGIIEVETNESGTMCGFDFSVGEKYLVYAYGQPGDYSVSSCSRTKHLDYAAMDLEELGPGKIIDPNERGYTSRLFDISFSQFLMIVFLFICLGGIGFLVYFAITKYKSQK